MIIDKIGYMQKTIVLLLFLLINYNSFSQSDEQPVFYGIGGVYDFQTMGKAADVRMLLPIADRLYISPRFSYFFSFNKIYEYYAGAEAKYFFSLNNTIKPYAYIGGYY